MKNKNYLFILAMAIATFFSSCHCNPKCKPTPMTSVSGLPLTDTTNSKRLYRLEHNTVNGNNYLGYYFTNSVALDTSAHPPVLTVMAQASRYDSTNQSWVLHTSVGASQAYSNISLNTDTITATYAGPFSITAGYFYSSNGYLHYRTKTADSTVCPISSIIYWNQGGSGQGVAIGYVAQNDLH